ncbi:cation:proton antiporter [Enterococcus faecium]|uniref:cation:proton antiporter n=1 Tax=Enterococcus faecium TaxID=1352 RepID=UPI000A7243D7|nr:cation:proton antiporter [Enterococcus faecium]MCZ1701524.1 cation:proton antiporter [Enterococcus faecium]MCZ1712126.1 cation:proton antiporter [Enterococcus faecium]MDT0281454.1 cation:proton antiporter [Enterococcus faecium]HAP8787383.1 cation:proton antiporter [Enterococcus faecium]HAP8819344.1 cation:proton antiporter [Enterococcus faecium]
MINLFLLVTASTLFFTGISLIISYLIYKKAENHTSKATRLAVSSFLTLLTLFVTLSFSFV